MDLAVENNARNDNMTLEKIARVLLDNNVCLKRNVKVLSLAKVSIS